MTIAILNTAICTTPGLDYRVRKISLDQARSMVAAGFASAVGHQATADILSALLGAQVPMNRCLYAQQAGETALVFKLRGRLEEGKILSAEEIEAVGYDFWTMEAVLPS